MVSVAENSNEPFDCEPGEIRCFRDCCQREVQFCNPREQRCQNCETREVYCNNQTLLPQECDLHCYKLLHENHIQDCQIYVILTWLFGAVLTVLLLCAFGYCIWTMVRKWRTTRIISTIDLARECSGSDQSLLGCEETEKDGPMNDAQNNTTEGDSTQIDANNIAATGIILCKDQPRVPTAVGGVTSAPPLLSAEPWGQMQSPQALPPALMPQQPQPAGDIRTTMNQDLILHDEIQVQSQSRSNGRVESDRAPRDNQQDCRDPRLYNVNPTTPHPDRTATGQIQYAI